MRCEENLKDLSFTHSVIDDQPDLHPCTFIFFKCPHFKEFVSLISNLVLMIMHNILKNVCSYFLLYNFYCVVSSTFPFSILSISMFSLCLLG